MIRPRGVHPIIHREIATDKVGAHGCVFAREGLGFPHAVGLVFAVVDTDGAGVASGCCGCCGCSWCVYAGCVGGGGGRLGWGCGCGFVGGVEGVGPVAAFAETCLVLLVSIAAWMGYRMGGKAYWIGRGRSTLYCIFNGSLYQMIFLLK